MQNTRTRPQRPASRRRPHTRSKPIRRRRMGWRPIATLVFLGLVCVTFAWAVLSLVFAPTGNTAAARFDTLIVLGAPADPDGNPRPVMLSRVAEAVKEYDRGIAPRMIFTGGTDGRQYSEAVVMARAAASRGVPASAIFVEANSNDTIHNACYSARIMKDHGWRSAEVITSPVHMRRAGIVFSHSHMDWRMHAAPPIEPQSASEVNIARAYEVLKVVRYHLYGEWAEPCTP